VTAVRIETVDRYTPLAQALHWATAVLMLAAVVLAWIFMAMPGTQAGRFAYITLHKSIGETIFLLAVIRLVWRSRHPAPRGTAARWEAYAARFNHWMLYGIIIVMPVSGYILSTAAARPSPYFWLFYWPQPSLAPGVAHAALQLHLFGQFLVYGFVGLHMLGAGWHILVRRDATLERMLPEQQLASQQH
jgi:cytochrome b561